jgi:alkanesulfonate monooxygenase SsuD/methylene tetrahydromethanopterin reductase-like flavin-dependent oxidoreductase (luciferase family)
LAGAALKLAGEAADALSGHALDIPYYNPVMLARRLTTIDFLSNGRLRVGLSRWMLRAQT